MPYRTHDAAALKSFPADAINDIFFRAMTLHGACVELGFPSDASSSREGDTFFLLTEVRGSNVGQDDPMLSCLRWNSYRFAWMTVWTLSTGVALEAWNGFDFASECPTCGDAWDRVAPCPTCDTSRHGSLVVEGYRVTTRGWQTPSGDLTTAEVATVVPGAGGAMGCLRTLGVLINDDGSDHPVPFYIIDALHDFAKTRGY